MNYGYIKIIIYFFLGSTDSLEKKSDPIPTDHQLRSFSSSSEIGLSSVWNTNGPYSTNDSQMRLSNVIISIISLGCFAFCLIFVHCILSFYPVYK